jgi:non-specific protein-tyrosine kinase
MTMSSTTAQLADHTGDLREYLRILRSRRVSIAVVTAVCLAAALVLSFQATPVYEGQSKVLVKPVQTVTSTSLSLPQAPNLDTERELILSQAVAGVVRRTLHLGTSVDDLLRHVAVEVVSDTEVLVIKYDDPDPHVAARLANGFAAGYVDFRTQEALDAFQAAAGAVQRRIDSLQTRLTALNSQIESTAGGQLKDSLQSERDSLVAQLGVMQQRLADLQATGSATQAAAQVVQTADVPSSPVSPNKTRNAALALFAGLVLGVVYAFGRERFEDRVKSREEVEGRLGAPVLAAVPRAPGWRRAEEAHLTMLRDPRSPISEAYRTLATNLQYMATQRPLRVVMVTSALAGEGKSTTASNLAVALAQAGRRVILLSTDLRRPRIHAFFSLHNDRGLSNILSDGQHLSQVTMDPAIPNLRIINAGPEPSDPAALLGGRRAGEFLQSLRDVAEFVVVDTPPVLAVADASILAPMVDGTIFVVDAEQGRRSDLAEARDQLQHAGARIIGAVYNNFDGGPGAAYQYRSYESGTHGHLGLATSNGGIQGPKSKRRRVPVRS